MLPLLAFDLDGTLIDSAQDIATALNFTFRKYGQNELPVEKIIPYIGAGPRQLIYDTFKDQQIPEEKILEYQKVFIDKYYEVMLDTTTLYPGVREFIETYQGPIGIITNKPIEPTRKIIKHLQIDHYPWIEVFGADSLAERKPSPLPLNTMMAKINYQPKQCIMIGDGIPDMESAVNAQVRSIAIEFGYTELEILKKYEPSHILRSYDDLHEIIKKMS